jgi:hypothetical protein
MWLVAQEVADHRGDDQGGVLQTAEMSPKLDQHEAGQENTLYMDLHTPDEDDAYSPVLVIPEALITECKIVEPARFLRCHVSRPGTDECLTGI